MGVTQNEHLELWWQQQVQHQGFTLLRREVTRRTEIHPGQRSCGRGFSKGDGLKATAEVSISASGINNLSPEIK